MSELHYMPLLNIEYFKSLNNLKMEIGDFILEHRHVS